MNHRNWNIELCTAYRFGGLGQSTSADAKLLRALDSRFASAAKDTKSMSDKIAVCTT